MKQFSNNLKSLRRVVGEWEKIHVKKSQKDIRDVEESIKTMFEHNHARLLSEEDF
jgi:hypothetical protein